MITTIIRTVREGITRRVAAVWAFVLGVPRRLAASLVAAPTRLWQFLLDFPGRIWRGLLATKRTIVGPDPEPGELVLGIVMSLTVVGVVGSFLFANNLVVYPFGALLVATGVGWFTYQDRTAKILTLVATVGTVLTVGFITYYLFDSAWPAIQEFGIGLLTVTVDQEGNVRWFFWLEGALPVAEESISGWDPANGLYSLLPAIWATVIVTLIAGAVAGPLGLFGALFIAEVASEGVREVIKPAVEILAGIPSIVYGFIGFQVLNSFVQDSFLDPGASFLIAGIIVGVMALPTVVSVAEDSLSSVPNSMKDGSVAMGTTEWQTMKSISIPAAFSGISAAVILGLGRAIGETMAVAATMAAGQGIADPLYNVFDQSVTLTSRIATAYGSASDTTVEVLFVAGVILFLIVAGMSVLAQYIERRMKLKLEGER
jgi:phosphate transport system permease protein